ncbi:hypothetical protein TNCV_2448541 [Trichonephila clavipes]|uniref:Transposase n=1 Tax=Trichonephila clavipes TaxID=2585209 RepID=A0A8X6STG8_TRICX|nr:hypothetical protein TNCV_2448541 [Trichonephila clavipes]
MITNFFIPELNNHDVQELLFQQDGATCHTARATIDLLKDTLSDRLISRFGLVNWPPRSCDLTPQNSLGVQGLPTYLPLSPTSRENLRFVGYMRKVIQLRKHYTFTNIHVFSGIWTQPNDTAASVANRYAGWATSRDLK